MNGVRQRLSLDQMLKTRANRPKDLLWFEFLRDVEMLDRELGEQFPGLREAKGQVLKSRTAMLVESVVESLRPMLATNYPDSVIQIVARAMGNGEKILREHLVREETFA